MDAEPEHLIVILAAHGGPLWELFRFAYAYGWEAGEAENEGYWLDIERARHAATKRRGRRTSSVEQSDPAPSTHIRRATRHGVSSVRKSK